MPKKHLTLLHTSDWHLGRRLFDRKRHDEAEAFLAWLLKTLEEKETDVLVIAGDVFDTVAPGARAQEMYYGFLAAAARTCRHIVVVSGNHDPAALLDAPKNLLKTFSIHVVGSACADPADEVLVLKDDDGTPELAVCAVPFLRERDLRTVEAGEAVGEKDEKVHRCIRTHYEAVFAAAKEKCPQGDIPVIATGHLFAAGGKTGEGERDLYVGSLGQVGGDIFACFDYTALGHLHVPQTVGGNECIRYSGSPFPMGFGEAGQQKSVCLVGFDGGRKTTVETVAIPVFQKLESIRGSADVLLNRIGELAEAKESCWVEAIHSGDAMVPRLREQLFEAAEGSCVEILRVVDERTFTAPLLARQGEYLCDLRPDDVFERCLEANGVTEEERPELRRAFSEIVFAVQNPDAEGGEA